MGRGGGVTRWDVRSRGLNRQRGSVIANDTIEELSRGDVDRIAGRMRLVTQHVEVVEAKREVDRIPIVEPVRTGEGEQSGEAGE